MCLKSDLQAADTQLGLMYNFGKNGTDGTPYPDSQWDDEIELCKKSVEILNNLQPKPAFFIVCGDLVDAFATEYPEIRARQEADLKEVYRGLDPSVPMICVCGNHDVGNVPTPASIERYKDSFGDDYFSFYKGGCAFLVLQSQFYEDATLVQEQFREHEAWLEEQLKLAKEREVTHIVIFQHIPWFLKDWAEGKDYFNVEKELRLKKLEQDFLRPLSQECRRDLQGAGGGGHLCYWLPDTRLNNRAEGRARDAVGDSEEGRDRTPVPPPGGLPSKGQPVNPGCGL